MTSDLHPLQHPLYKLSTYPYKMSLIFIENPLNPTKGAMQNQNQNNKRTKNASWKQTQMWEFRTNSKTMCTLIYKSWDFEFGLD